ncbi:hypothetical protein GN278_06135 [Rhodobacteraceae bacterium Araon29]
MIDRLNCVPSFHAVKFLAILILCGACGGPSDGTDSGFVTPSNTGDISSNVSDSIFNSRSGKYIDEDGDGYAYVAGATDDQSGFRGYAGLVPSTSVEAPPSSGQAQMKGVYGAATISEIEMKNGFIVGTMTGRLTSESGAITLTADFAKGTLGGTSDNGKLVVNGKFSGKDLTGSVSLSGVAGELDGLVGGQKAIGAFHGDSSTNIIAGGFLVNAE